ncbi:hypothetical protein [Sulfobacillus harzensis]|uniref:Short chain dehydrogenase n=1 Tax=Sulfobacillus harzensis TaxID=2729629 RepID=A0A7Y0Q455_9FIRM|nr:hypothetical protein [Sulfobacillus harzensis]NMP24978.1 hypothetical protein [Sulfobacillus harzensis]
MYSPSGVGTESLSRIMAEDLKPFRISVNILLPGGATRTTMILERVSQMVQAGLLVPAITGPPMVFLASNQAYGFTGEQIEATYFDAWCREHGIDR